MTIAEMHTAFDLGCDLIATTGYPGSEPEEKDLFINRAIERFIKTRYSGINPKRESFEETQKRIDDLRTLVVRNTNTATTVVQNTDTEWIAGLPQIGSTDPVYMHLISSSVNIDTDECGNPVQSRKIKIKQVTHDQLEEYLDDPYKKPDFNECLLLFEGNFVYMYTNGLYNILTFNMTYLTYPTVVNFATNTDCNLPVHTHQEIVDLAVLLYIAGQGDGNRMQIESSTLNTNE